MIGNRIKAPAVKPGELPGRLKNVGGLRRVYLEEYEPGVYFLCYLGEVVYVGQSTRPKARISEHVADGTKSFDRVFIRHCRADELDELESFFIHSLEPRYNCTMPNGQMLAPKSMKDIETTARHLLGKATQPEPRLPASRAEPSPASSAPDRLLRLPDVMFCTGMRKSAIYESMKSGTFPAGRKWGRATFWPQSEIDAWVRRLAAPAGIEPASAP